MHWQVLYLRFKEKRSLRQCLKNSLQNLSEETDAEVVESLKALPKASGSSCRGPGLSLDHLLRRIFNADLSF